MRNRILIAAAFVLAACANAPEPVESDSGTAGFGAHVTYRYGSDLDEAQAQASAYCGKFRRRAFLRGTASDENGNRATFDCR